MKTTAGKHHAWYETDLGYPIRKPLGVVRRAPVEIEYIPLPQEIAAAQPWWLRFWRRIKKLWS